LLFTENAELAAFVLVSDRTNQSEGSSLFVVDDRQRPAQQFQWPWREPQR
jgi:hypothetical protein